MFVAPIVSVEGIVVPASNDRHQPYGELLAPGHWWNTVTSTTQ